MNTPIVDFVRAYSQTDALRLHMPGHKGHALMGMEGLDITEIEGADSLYEANGIIAESEKNASALFDAPTFYSTEGSSLAIRAMLYLAALHARQQGKRPLVAAGRNAHKVFLSAAALLDFDVLWLTPDGGDSYLSCALSAESLDRQLTLADKTPTAVYLTSPDYLGNTLDMAALAAVCRQKGILLLVDNAHGAYLKFLSPSLHPLDLGADLVCDSAHKTLPVLTGGAYLHLAKKAPAFMQACAKDALALFGSTSPSYLILQSLDAANAYLANGYPETLAGFLAEVAALKEHLAGRGYVFCADEPLKLTLAAKACGHTGTDLARELAEKRIVCEFADPDFLVLMLTPTIGVQGLLRLEEALAAIPRKRPLTSAPPTFGLPMRVLSVREAMLSPSERVSVKDSVGRVLASATVGCPPAVPIVVSGERIDEEAVAAFSYYGITHLNVVKDLAVKV